MHPYHSGGMIFGGVDDNIRRAFRSVSFRRMERVVVVFPVEIKKLMGMHVLRRVDGTQMGPSGFIFLSLTAAPTKNETDQENGRIIFAQSHNGQH
mmetsp:Transcript_35254/g.73834  ORF Transcript_35254/g.73834 Transcript_35254/m.73834 type:complete len:95 (-) Transcript_35254:150-434(-)